MKIAKTLSALSLAFALQLGALTAATVVLAPSDAAAAVSKKKVQKKSQKKAPARSKAKKTNNDGLGDDLTPKLPTQPPGGKWNGGGNPGNQMPGHGEIPPDCRKCG